MRIDLPRCNFKNCKYCFDSNCTKKNEYERCEYRQQKSDIEGYRRLEVILNTAVDVLAADIRSKEIKKFAERLRNKFFNYYDGLTENTSKSNHNGDSLMFYEVADMIVDCIDNTMEEMTEEKE